jgi:hypothetical protein
VNRVLRFDPSTLERQGNNTEFPSFQVTSYVAKISEAGENRLLLIETKSNEINSIHWTSTDFLSVPGYIYRSTCL